MIIKKHNKTGGRNNTGQTTSFHRGGGHKQRARWVNFNYAQCDGISKVSYQTYDPLRSGLVGQTSQTIKGRYLQLLPSLKQDNDMTVTLGVTLGSIPSHTQVFNIEMVPGKGGQLVRSAGCFATVVNHVANYTRIRLPSGEQRLILSQCKCSIGTVGGSSNKDKSLKLHRMRKGKAGRSRWLGRRPTVRGTAMNPVDHPHGGGQGKTSGGRPSVTPWSVPKGVRTSSGRGSSFIVVSRRG